MIPFLSLFLLALPRLLVAAAVPNRVVVSSLPSVPAGWRELQVALSDEPIFLRLALNSKNEGMLEQKALAIATPGNPEYGKHLTLEQLRNYSAPSAPAVAAVTRWIGQHGIRFSIDNYWVEFTTTVGAANELLDTTFAWYVEPGGGGRKLRTLSYSVPGELSGYIKTIQPTTRFGQLAAQRSTIFEATRLRPVSDEASPGAHTDVDDALDADDCSAIVTPACLKTLYNIQYTASAANNSVGFCSYLGEYSRYADLASFISKYVPAAAGQSFSVVEINGGQNNQTSTNDSIEANLDLQYVLGLSHPVSIIEYSTGGLGPLVPTFDDPAPPGNNEPYMDFLNFILSQPDSSLPQTLSTSYGEEEQSVPEDYALTVCNLFMQLGARGVSVLFSSGDSGPGMSCVRNTDNATYFNPTFPAGCPYVTAVGATTGSAPEQAAAFSSGGFSIYHARPGWQDNAVAPYLTSIGSTYAPYFNASGRGIPDVAAQGVDFAVVDQGYVASVDGTSASSPTFAGVVAMLNAARSSHGLPPLGFLNPWLYKNRGALTDIATGYSSGCVGSDQAVKVFGWTGARWNATSGWDPVTGLGTPRFDLLLAAAAPGVANA